MEKDWDVVAVGGGSAGLSAALMLARSRRRVVVVDAGSPRNRYAAHMHGVLGHDGKSPLALLADGRREVANYGGVIVERRVQGVVKDGATFAVSLDDGAVLTTRRLIVATGLRDELPEIEGLADRWGKGIVSCPYCDGYEHRDSRIGVIATGSGSVHQAQLVRQLSARVTYLQNGTESPQGDALPALQARGIAIDEGRIARILGDEKGVTGVEFTDGRRSEVDVIFTAPSLVPVDGILRELGAELEDAAFGRFVKTDASGKTSLEGVWAIGNVANGMANVPAAMGAGSFAGAGVNADLVAEDVADAVARLQDQVAACS